MILERSDKCCPPEQPGIDEAAQARFAEWRDNVVAIIERRRAAIVDPERVSPNAHRQADALPPGLNPRPKTDGGSIPVPIVVSPHIVFAA